MQSYPYRLAFGQHGDGVAIADAHHAAGEVGGELGRKETQKDGGLNHRGPKLTRNFHSQLFSLNYRYRYLVFIVLTFSGFAFHGNRCIADDRAHHLDGSRPISSWRGCLRLGGELDA